LTDGRILPRIPLPSRAGGPRKSVVSFMIVFGNTFPPSKRSGLWGQCFAQIGSNQSGFKVFGISLTGLALLAGCSDPEGIREYAAPRDVVAKPAPAMASPATTGPTRMLAAILARPDATWFVKLMGPATQLENQGAPFISLLQSIKFEKPDEPTFTVPGGWTRDDSNPARFATLKLPSTAGPVEATIIKLGAQAGSDLENINRWRGQVGLGPIGEKDMATATKEMEIAGKKAIFVDMIGPGAPKTGGPFSGMMGNRPPAPTSEDTKKGGIPTPPERPTAQIGVVLPQGWKEIPPKPLSLKSYQAANGTVDITITPLAGPAGGLGANINRWRTQVGLEAVDNAKAEADAKPVPSSAGKALFVDLPGKGANAKSIAAGIISKGSETWFIKMMGPADGVAKEKSALAELLKTLKLPE